MENTITDVAELAELSEFDEFIDDVDLTVMMNCHHPSPTPM